MPDYAFAAASWRDPAFWRRVAPLGIGSPPQRKRKRPTDDADEAPQFARDGFATLSGDATTAALAEQCADAIERLAARGLPAACVFLYDEAWALVSAFAPRTTRPVSYTHLTLPTKA